MDRWEKELSCASECSQCQQPLASGDQRVLSVFTHGVICMSCKKSEEKREGYENASKEMISRCIKETGKPYGSPEGYCFHHFCPYKC